MKNIITGPAATRKKKNTPRNATVAVLSDTRRAFYGQVNGG